MPRVGAPLARALPLPLLVASALLVSVSAACTDVPRRDEASIREPTPSSSVGASPTASPTETAVPTFDAARALETVEGLAALGPRETTSETYRRASALVGRRFRALGYDVTMQRFAVPAGDVDGVHAGAGETRNVIARPAGFDPRAPHLVVGGHLDTVPDSPGANDNASGVAVVLELARLAARHPPGMPVVFVAFGAEERRRRSETRSTTFLGAQAYIDRMNGAERRSLRGMVNLDMVGNGSEVLVLGGRGPISAALLGAARRLDIAARPSSVFDRFSDHQAFRDSGYPVGWLWAGDHPTLHRPDDTIDIIQRRMLRNVGAIAWEALQRLRLR